MKTNSMSNKKIALILPNNVWFCPYVSIYTNVLDARGISYDIISWNREGVSEDAIQYNYTIRKRNSFLLLWAYNKFSYFVKKTIINNGYEKLIIFTPQLGIFLCDFLKNKFKGRYIFDYRDLSIEQKWFFKYSFTKVIKNSFSNVISSPGFKKKLPCGFNYLLSHNFNVDLVKQALIGKFDVDINKNPIDVLTIGGIRDYESNVQIINNLANVDGFFVRFVGKGPSVNDLKKYVEKLKICNLTFEGYYPKNKESVYVLDATFLNIFYPRKKTHDVAISNRFYNSLIYRKPMITTKNTIQGDYVEKFHLGVAIENCENLPFILQSYLDSMDMNKFIENCNNLLRNFLSDYEIWKKTLLVFVSKGSC